MTDREDYKIAYLELFDFDQQIRACCEMKTNVTIQSNIAFEPDGRTHPFPGLRREPLRFFVEVEGQYCLITPTVCLMACRGLVWATHAPYTPDYKPTPDEALALQLASFEMGHRGIDEIDCHCATVDIVPRDDVDQGKIRKSIRLH